MKKTFIFMSLLFVAGVIFAKDLYVSDARGNNKNDGLSWNSPVKTIHYAMSKATNGDVLHVESGTYKLTKPVQIKDGVSLFGGYQVAKKGKDFDAIRPTVKNAAPWNFEAITIISGDVYDGRATNTSSKNTRLFESLSTSQSSIIIDGFTFTNGNGKSTVSDESGGAIFSRTPGITIRNCTFSENGVIKEDNTRGGHGGAIYSDESATIENCYFLKNYADGGSSGGGGAFLRPKSGEISVKNCVFEGNTSNVSGAGLRTSGLNKVTIEDCSFFNNVAQTGDTPKGGAAIYLAGNFNPTVPSVSEVKNCYIYNNLGSSSIYISGGTIDNSTIANNAGGIFIASEGVNIQNSAIWGNISSSNGNPTAVNIKEKSNTIKIGNCASDRKVADYSVLMLNSSNDHANGPQFVNPSKFTGVSKDGNAFSSIDFSVKASSVLIKNNIGVQTKK